MLEKEQLVSKLKKSLYGLKQATRQWYLKFDRFMVNNDFTTLEANHCCYSKWFKNFYIMILLYVNGMLVAGSSMKEIMNLKDNLAKEFTMKNLGPARKILK